MDIHLEGSNWVKGEIRLERVKSKFSHYSTTTNSTSEICNLEYGVELFASAIMPGNEASRLQGDSYGEQVEKNLLFNLKDSIIVSKTIINDFFFGYMSM